MYDVELALSDLANQLKACRSQDGLTLKQLADRCEVAASTIHKIESQQMIPTVSVLLKIARGLGRRPEELVRDRWDTRTVERKSERRDAAASDGTDGMEATFDSGVGAWRVDLGRGDRLDPVPLDPGQRAILYVEAGQGGLATPTRRIRLQPGECVEISGETFSVSSQTGDPVAALLIMSPAGRTASWLGPPNTTPQAPPGSRPAKT